MRVEKSALKTRQAVHQFTPSHSRSMLLIATLLLTCLCGITCRDGDHPVRGSRIYIFNETRYALRLIMYDDTVHDVVLLPGANTVERGVKTGDGVRWLAMPIS